MPGGRPRETLSSKRGKERLKKHGDKYVTRYMKLLDKGYQMAMGDGAKFSQVMQVAEEYRGAIEQAFGPPTQEVALTASVITPDIHAEIARALQHQVVFLQSRNLLMGGNDATDNQGQKDNESNEKDVRSETWDEGILCKPEQKEDNGNPQETEVVNAESEATNQGETWGAP